MSDYDRSVGGAGAPGRVALVETESGSSAVSTGALTVPQGVDDGPEEKSPALKLPLLRSRAPGPPTAGADPSRPEPPCASPSSAGTSACAEHRGALRDENLLTVEVGDSLRSFTYYAPPTLDPEVPTPLLILAHGRTLDAAQLLSISQFESLADREGFLLLAPDGQRPAPWNIGQDNCLATSGPVASAPGDDQALLDAMLAFVSGERAVDGAHVFMVGFGAGGYWANETACVRPAIRAFGAHSAGSHPLANCASAPVPTILFHGLRDNVVPADCSRETRARWAERNGCAAEVEQRPVLGGVCEYSAACPEGGQVALCLFDALGLAWAGGVGQPGVDPAASASASELSWDFFKTYAW